MINGRRVAALCISRLGDNTCFDLVSSLQKTLVEHDCSLFIYNINSDLYNKEAETAEVYVYELIDYSVIDAIIIDPEKIKSSAGKSAPLYLEPSFLNPVIPAMAPSFCP